MIRTKEMLYRHCFSPSVLNVPLRRFKKVRRNGNLMGHLGLWYIDNVNLLVENVFFFPVALQAQREPWAFRIIAQKRLLA